MPYFLKPTYPTLIHFKQRSADYMAKDQSLQDKFEQMSIEQKAMAPNNHPFF